MDSKHLARSVALLTSIGLSGAVDASFVYQLDDGSAEATWSLLTVTDTQSQLFLNRFNVVGGNNLINSISVAWHSPLGFDDEGLPLSGANAKVAVWEDPNDDGNPIDAVLVGTPLDVLTANELTNIFNSYDIADVFVSGSFFVGVIFDGPRTDGVFPVSMDETDPDHQRSWLALTEQNALNGPFIALFQMEEDLAGDWMIRAEATSIPEPATLALFGLGLAGLGAVRRKKRAA